MGMSTGDQSSKLTKWALSFFDRECEDGDDNFILLRGDQDYAETVALALRKIYPTDRDPFVDLEILYDYWFLEGAISKEDSSMLVLSDGATASLKIALFGMQITSNGSDEELYVAASECFVAELPEYALIADRYAIYFDTWNRRIMAMSGSETEFQAYPNVEAFVRYARSLSETVSGG